MKPITLTGTIDEHHRLVIDVPKDVPIGDVEVTIQPKGSEPTSVGAYHIPTREELLREVEILRQTPVRPGDSLLGKYANPNVPDMSEAEFHAQMREIATEWEHELDEFYNDET